MTVINQMKFTCDRCGISVEHPTENKSPLQRISAEGWITLLINSTDKARHLCPLCSDRFTRFLLEGGKAENEPSSL